MMIMVGKQHLLLGPGRFLLTIWFLIAVILLLSGVVHSFAFFHPHGASSTLKHQQRHVQQQLFFQQRRFQALRAPTTRAHHWSVRSKTIRCLTLLNGWVQRALDGEWEWAEDDPNFVASSTKAATATFSPLVTIPSATPQLPSGSYRPKQSLGQNYLKDPNTVAKILRAFHQDAMRSRWHTSSSSSSNDEAQQPPPTLDRIIELGPGAGALTDKLVETYGAETIQCIEIDDRSVDILREKHPNLDVLHDDVLQVDYPLLACGGGGGAEVQREDQLVLAGTSRAKPLVVIGNLPYYITSQILFALADASHVGAIQCATVTMQWEVGQRLVAKVGSKEYGILSVVFQLYTSAVHCHFKIPPTVFYPKPKVDSALIGLHFAPPDQVLQPRLAGVNPIKLRRVVTTAFQQRRKTLRNSLRKLARDAVVAAPLPDTTLTDGSWDAALPRIPLPLSVRQLAKEGDVICAQQELPEDWASKRPEELTPGQFVELTRKLFGPFDDEGPFPTANMQALPAKVWRKLKHGPKE